LISNPNFAEIKISNHDKNNLTIPAETALDLKIFVTIPAQKINEITEDRLLIEMILEDLELILKSLIKKHSMNKIS
jgi:hypothetical protein